MNKTTELGNKKWVVWLSILSSIIAIITFLSGKNLPDFFSADPGVTSTPYEEISTSVSFFDSIPNPTQTPSPLPPTAVVFDIGSIDPSLIEAVRLYDYPIVSIETPLTQEEKNSKCEWAKINFPKSKEMIATELGVPIEYLELKILNCPDGSEIVQAVYINGIQPKSEELGYSYHKLQVPPLGCIDVFNNEERVFISGAYDRINEVSRIKSGSVVTSLATVYWPYCDYFRP